MNESAFSKLTSIIESLHHPETGCPWDLKQTHQSLLKHLIEETYEFVYAVESKIKKNMEEELGDVLLQVLFHAKISQKNNSFDFDSVCQKLSDKLVRRHPHVFKNKEAQRLSADQALGHWEKEKDKEKKPLIDESLLASPSLYSAYKIGKKSHKAQFDWNNYLEVLEVVREEMQELKEELSKQNQEKIEEEIGDVLFSLAQLSRHLKINPEEALRKSNKKFIRRFQMMEKLMKKDGDSKEIDKEKYWKKAKKLCD